MGEMTKVTDIFLEEQDWVPGVSAPVFVWGITIGAGLIALGGAWWIYQHNKE